jgi:hypothetical protein
MTKLWLVVIALFPPSLFAWHDANAAGGRGAGLYRDDPMRGNSARPELIACLTIVLGTARLSSDAAGANDEG